MRILSEQEKRLGINPLDTFLFLQIAPYCEDVCVRLQANQTKLDTLQNRYDKLSDSERNDFKKIEQSLLNQEWKLGVEPLETYQFSQDCSLQEAKARIHSNRTKLAEIKRRKKQVARCLAYFCIEYGRTGWRGESNDEWSDRDDGYYSDKGYPSFSTYKHDITRDLLAQENKLGINPFVTKSFIRSASTRNLERKIGSNEIALAAHLKVPTTVINLNYSREIITLVPSLAFGNQSTMHHQPEPGQISCASLMKLIISITLLLYLFQNFSAKTGKPLGELAIEPYNEATDEHSLTNAVKINSGNVRPLLEKPTFTNTLLPTHFSGKKYSPLLRGRRSDFQEQRHVESNKNVEALQM